MFVLCDSRSPQVPRTLWILADINNAIVRTVSSRPLIFMSSSPCINPLVTLARAPNTIVTTVTFMFHSFFPIPLQGSDICRSFRLPSVLPSDQPERQSLLLGKFSFFFFFSFFWLSLGLVVWPWLNDPIVLLLLLLLLLLHLFSLWSR